MMALHHLKCGVSCRPGVTCLPCGEVGRLRPVASPCTSANCRVSGAFAPDGPHGGFDSHGGAANHPPFDQIVYGDKWRK